MNAFLALALLAAAAAGAFLLRIASVYGEVRRAFRATARDLDLAYREVSLFRPQLFGHRRGKTLLVELSGRHFAPDAIRVVWAGRIHTRAGLSISPELIDDLVNLLAESEERERERGEAIP